MPLDKRLVGGVAVPRQRVEHFIVAWAARQSNGTGRYGTYGKASDDIVAYALVPAGCW